MRLLSLILLALAIYDLILQASRPLPIPVLLIHAVSANRGAHDVWTLSPEAFADLVRLLKDEGRETLGPDQIARALDGTLHPALARRGLVLTIDDGHRSAMDVVAPALARAGLSGIFFMNSKKTPPIYLGPDQIKALARQHVVGSHGATHRSLKRAPGETETGFAQALTSELTGSRTDLEALVGSPVTTLSYPFGDVDEKTVAAARAAGYTLAFTTDTGHLEAGMDRMRLPRFQLTSTTDLATVRDYLKIPYRDRLRRALLLGFLMMILIFYHITRGSPGRTGSAPR